jgi:hypothetical protein
VKYLIPTLAVLVLALCAGLHREEKGTLAPPTQGQPKVKVPEAKGLAEVGSEPLPATSLKAVEAVRVLPSIEAAKAPSAPNLSTQEMSDKLRDELSLSEEQLVRVNTALQERSAELAECHESIRRSGVFVPMEYGKQLQRMKDGWYRKIDGVLDSHQHLIFDDLVGKGFLRPGTEFAADLNVMTVIR